MKSLGKILGGVIGAAVVGVLVTLALRPPAWLTGPSGGAPKQRKIELYLDEYVRGAPDGIHVADVILGTDGGARLTRWSDDQVARKVRTALEKLSGLKTLEVQEEAAVEIDGKSALAMTFVKVKRSDARWAWGVGRFLRLNTGLKYKIVDAKVPSS